MIINPALRAVLTDGKILFFIAVATYAAGIDVKEGGGGIIIYV
jgi:hypothetical protein